MAHDLNQSAAIEDAILMSNLNSSRASDEAHSHSNGEVQAISRQQPAGDGDEEVKNVRVDGNSQVLIIDDDIMNVEVIRGMLASKSVST